MSQSMTAFFSRVASHRLPWIQGQAHSSSKGSINFQGAPAIEIPRQPPDATSIVAHSAYFCCSLDSMFLYFYKVSFLSPGLFSVAHFNGPLMTRYSTCLVYQTLIMLSESLRFGAAHFQSRARLWGRNISRGSPTYGDSRSRPNESPPTSPLWDRRISYPCVEPNETKRNSR